MSLWGNRADREEPLPLQVSDTQRLIANLMLSDGYQGYSVTGDGIVSGATTVKGLQIVGNILRLDYYVGEDFKLAQAERSLTGMTAYHDDQVFEATISFGGERWEFQRS